MTEDEFRASTWCSYPRPESVDDQLRAVEKAWTDGRLARGEADGLYFDVAVFGGIDEVLRKMPEAFRVRLLESLMAWATAPLAGIEGSVRVFGGIYSYEVEHDPVKRAQMKAELEARHAAEDAYLVDVVQPRIIAWWMGRLNGEHS